MRDNRPVNLDIGTMRLPITAWASISHRISGVVLFMASIGLLWALDLSLSSAEGFASLAALLGTPAVRVLLWLLGTALAYHLFAGLRHLAMDFGVGETLRGGTLGAWLVIGLAVAASLLLGVALW